MRARSRTQLLMASLNWIIAYWRAVYASVYGCAVNNFRYSEIAPNTLSNHFPKAATNENMQMEWNGINSCAFTFRQKEKKSKHTHTHKDRKRDGELSFYQVILHKTSRKETKTSRAFCSTMQRQKGNEWIGLDWNINKCEGRMKIDCMIYRGSYVHASACDIHITRHVRKRTNELFYNLSTMRIAQIIKNTTRRRIDLR